MGYYNFGNAIFVGRAKLWLAVFGVIFYTLSWILLDCNLWNYSVNCCQFWFSVMWICWSDCSHAPWYYLPSPTQCKLRTLHPCRLIIGWFVRLRILSRHDPFNDLWWLDEYMFHWLYVHKSRRTPSGGGLEWKYLQIPPNINFVSNHSIDMHY